jgi:hypothetical protein
MLTGISAHSYLAGVVAFLICAGLFAAGPLLGAVSGGSRSSWTPENSRRPNPSRWWHRDGPRFSHPSCSRHLVVLPASPEFAWRLWSSGMSVFWTI